jgi:hypothetical protein
LFIFSPFFSPSADEASEAGITLSYDATLRGSGFSHFQPLMLLCLNSRIVISCLGGSRSAEQASSIGLSTTLNKHKN